MRTNRNAAAVLAALSLLLPATPADAAAPPECFGRRATVVGTPGDDVLRGGPRDVVVGLGGDDVITGRGRRFYACGNGGADQLRGGAEQDRLAGGGGHDRLYGSGKTDWMVGGSGDDVLVGDSKNDRRPGPDHLTGGDGNDRLYGFQRHDVIDGGEGDDELRGGDDNDDLTPGPGDDLVLGGHDHGSDELLFPAATAAVQVDLTEGTATGEGTDSVNEIELVVGTAYDDELIGSEARDMLYGLGGNDTIHGLDGNDYLSPDTPRHTGAYDPGDDHVDGGEGRDRISFATRLQSPLAVDLPAGTATGEGTDALTGIEHVFAVLDGMDVTVVGSADANEIYTGTGDDEIRGGAGDDFLHANLGEDVVDGEDGTDTCVHAEQATNCEA